MANYLPSDPDDFYTEEELIEYFSAGSAHRSRTEITLCSPAVGHNVDSSIISPAYTTDSLNVWFWHCPTHAMGNFGMPTRDDALAAAHEHARQYEGTPE